MPYLTYLEREAIKKGIKQGVQQGIQQGVRQGVQQGIQQGVQQGSLKIARESVLDILKIRFKRVPQSISKTIKSIEDISLLKTLHKKAVQIDSLNTFSQIIENPSNNKNSI